MKTQASLDAFEEINPKLSGLRKKVYNYIKNNPHCTIEEIANGLDIELKSIAGRPGELRDMGLVLLSGRRDKHSTFVAVALDKVSFFDIEIQRVEKFTQKIQNLEKDFPDLLDNYIKNKMK